MRFPLVLGLLLWPLACAEAPLPSEPELLPQYLCLLDEHAQKAAR